MSLQRWLLKLRSYVAWQGSRLARAPRVLANLVFGTLWYDAVLARHKQVHQGNVPASSRVVIYLIFPRNGLLESHFRALNHFQAHGYAPVVVSNLPLVPADRERLLAQVNQLIERPNYGYDFGGYRDGVRLLRDRLPTLKRLVLMNDSVWFPVARDQGWLPTAEAQGQDIVGAVANYFAEPADHVEISDAPFTWRYDTRNPRFHYCSFALSFGPAVLRDPRFLRFWDRLKLTNNKFDTIQRGEVGLGQWIVHSGHSHACTFDMSRFDADLDRLDDERLREVVQNFIIPESAALRRQKAMVLKRPTDAPDTRRYLKNFVLQATIETGAAYALLDFALNEKGYDFVKKSPLWLDPEGADTTLKLLQERGEHGLHEEARALVRKT